MKVEIMRIDRRRYVAFKIDSPRVLQRRDVIELLKPIFSKETINLIILIYDSKTMSGILRCNNRNLKDVRRLVNTSIQDTVIKTLKTSGTIKTLKNKLPELSLLKKKVKL